MIKSITNFLIIFFIFQQLKSQISQIDQNGYNVFCDETLHMLEIYSILCFGNFILTRVCFSLSRYNWTCHLIDNPTEPCFDSVSLSNQTAPLPSTNESLAFPSTWLRLDNPFWFVFYLTVSKEGRETVTTSQVIKVDNARTYE